MASSDGSLTQAEIYLFLDPRPVAEKNIIKMVDKSLEGLKLPDFDVPADAAGTDARNLIEKLAVTADKVLSQGLLTMEFHLEEAGLDSAAAEILTDVGEGVDPGEIIEGITQKIGSGRIPPEEQYRTMLSLYGGLLIAYGYQGEVLRIYLGQFV